VIHPIRDPEVIRAVEEWTALVLRVTGGAARVQVEFDYKAGVPASFRLQFEGYRKPLTNRAR
jgi:hypothetical protein